MFCRVRDFTVSPGGGIMEFAWRVADFGDYLVTVFRIAQWRCALYSWLFQLFWRVGVFCFGVCRAVIFCDMWVFVLLPRFVSCRRDVFVYLVWGDVRIRIFSFSAVSCRVFAFRSAITLQFLPNLAWPMCAHEIPRPSMFPESIWSFVTSSCSLFPRMVSTLNDMCMRMFPYGSFFDSIRSSVRRSSRIYALLRLRSLLPACVDFNQFLFYWLVYRRVVPAIRHICFSTLLDVVCYCFCVWIVYL